MWGLIDQSPYNNHSTVMELVTELVKKWNLIWFLNIK